jgi:predicted metal-binding transcription factor (methanogenesis marker protein 9)
MKMEQLREIAKKYHLRSVGVTKAELIRAIQRAEGNFDCFGSAERWCDQSACLYRDLCLGQSDASRSGPSGNKP